MVLWVDLGGKGRGAALAVPMGGVGSKIEELGGWERVVGVCW